MAVGDHFSKANYKAMYPGSSWEISQVHSAAEASHKYEWYESIRFNAQSFTLRLYAVSQWFASIYLDYRVYYYNESTRSWVLCESGTLYDTFGSGNNRDLVITHNRQNNGYGLTTNREDKSNNHCWFVTVSVDSGGTSGNENNYDAYVYLNAGATEMCDYSDSSCDFLWKPGEHIYGFKPSAYVESGVVPSGNPNPKGNYTGNPISVSAGTARYVYSLG